MFEFQALWQSTYDTLSKSELPKFLPDESLFPLPD